MFEVELKELAKAHKKGVKYANLFEEGKNEDKLEYYGDMYSESKGLFYDIVYDLVNRLKKMGYEQQCDPNLFIKKENGKVVDTFRIPAW